MQRLFAFFLIWSAPALAQSSFQVVAGSAKPGEPVRPTCMEQVAELRHQVDRFPHPARWSYVVACEEAQWPVLLGRAGYAASNGAKLYSFTNLQSAMSVFQGPALLSPDSRTGTSGMVVARELAHIYLQTQDDEAARQQAAVWLKVRKRPRAGGAAGAALPDGAGP